MKFFLPLKKDLRVLPPLISLVRGLAELGHEVDIFTYYSAPETLAALPAEGVSVTQVSAAPYPATEPAWKRLSETMRAYRALSRHLRETRDIDVVWRGTTDYRYLLSVLRRSGVSAPSVFQFHEHDPKYFHLCRQADHVIVPEENRAWLTKFAAGLAQCPFVLPNSPIDRPRKIDASARSADLQQLKQSGKRVLLYQGTMDFTRRCIGELIEALTHCNNQIVLALMPAVPLPPSERDRVNAAAHKVGVSDRLVVLETLAPPNHLHVIGQADIGIGLYRPTSLNQVYCAPNRIYEFTGFGIPVVLPAYPGMRELALRHDCFETCDPESPQSIAAAINHFDDAQRREVFTDAADRFFDERGDFVRNLQSVLACMSFGTPQRDDEMSGRSPMVACSRSMAHREQTG